MKLSECTLDRHLYIELAKRTESRRTRIIYLKNFARLWRKEVTESGCGNGGKPVG